MWTIDGVATYMESEMMYLKVPYIEGLRYHGVSIELATSGSKRWPALAAGL